MSEADGLPRTDAERQPGPVDLLDDELVLVSEHLKQARGRYEHEMRRLLRVECYIRSDLLIHERRMWWYSIHPDDHWRERDRLKEQLFLVERERRRDRAVLWKRVDELEDRLLALKHQRAIVRGS